MLLDFNAAPGHHPHCGFDDPHVGVSSAFDVRKH